VNLRCLKSLKLTGIERRLSLRLRMVALRLRHAGEVKVRLLGLPRIRACGRRGRRGVLVERVWIIRHAYSRARAREVARWWGEGKGDCDATRSARGTDINVTVM
jgi:hypothetical protein